MNELLTELSALAGGEDRLRGGLIVASNREPWCHQETGRGIRVERPAGGVVSALDTVLRHTGGTWVAWGSGSGDRDGADARGRVAVPPDDPRYTLRRVWLSPATVKNYYHGFANRVLWPLCHGEPGRVLFRKRFWEEYVLANRAFADAILEEGGGEAAVWLHDYHLCLVPAMIREQCPERTIALFWHIPWPSPELFQRVPHGGEILAGLLGNDLIGFQIPLHARNFLACATAFSGATVDHQTMTVIRGGRITRIGVFPVGIDFPRFDSLASSPETAARVAAIRADHHLPGPVGIGVDRLDFSKGLIEKLRAIGLFFQRYRRFRGAFTFLQVAVMTKSGEPYRSYRTEVRELVARINGKYAVDGWQPVILSEKALDLRELAACYRLADVAVVTPLWDGMNLVAKEYAASRGDGGGVLILGKGAGAAEELTDALLVDPGNAEGWPRPLTMPCREKRARMEHLRQRVREQTIYHWIGDIFHELSLVPFVREGRSRHILEQREEMAARLAGRKLLLCFDFDGTLSPIVERPEMAEMPEKIRSLLVLLKERHPVAIISGRGLADLRARVGIAGLIYAGNHGAELEAEGAGVAGPPDGLALPEGFLDRAREELEPFPGVLVEDKGVTATVHYRLVNPSRLAEFFAAFRALVRDYEGRLRVNEGRKVFEISPVGAWGKGEVLEWLMEGVGKGMMPIYVGDDTSDEEAFRAVRGKGMAVAIGGSREAEYYLAKQGEMAEFLELLAGISPERKGGGIRL